MPNYPNERSKIFQKIVDLKQKQKEKLQKIRKQMKQLERQNLSTSGFAKLTKKSINLIQKQRRDNILLLKSDFKTIEEFNKQLTALEKKYLNLI
ncbi:MAG: hypothetical protein ACE5RI_05690 [Candidatus Nitrosomaritimum yanchengensis]